MEKVKVYYERVNNDLYGNPRYEIFVGISDEADFSKVGRKKRNSCNRYIVSYSLKKDLEEELGKEVELIRVC